MLKASVDLIAGEVVLNYGLDSLLSVAV